MTTTTTPALQHQHQVQSLRPPNIRIKARLCFERTRRLSAWLVSEAGHYEIITNRYTKLGTWQNHSTGHREPHYQIRSVRDIEYLVNVIYNHNALTNVTNGARFRGALGDTIVDKLFLQEVRENAADRDTMTSWYVDQGSQAGSALERSNNGHGYFNAVLHRVLDKLEHMHGERG